MVVNQCLNEIFLLKQYFNEIQVIKQLNIVYGCSAAVILSIFDNLETDTTFEGSKKKISALLIEWSREVEFFELADDFLNFPPVSIGNLAIVCFSGWPDVSYSPKKLKILPKFSSKLIYFKLDGQKVPMDCYWKF